MSFCLDSLFLKRSTNSFGEDVLWIDLEGTDQEARKWLEEESGLEPLYSEALLAEETRPRSLGLPSKKALLLTLRGINTNPGEDPEDMVSLRIWAEEKRIITVHFQKVMALEDLRTAIAEGEGPENAGAFLASLCNLLNRRMGLLVSELGGGRG